MCEFIYMFIAGPPGAILIVLSVLGALVILGISCLLFVYRYYRAKPNNRIRGFKLGGLLAGAAILLLLLREYGVNLLPCDPVCLDFFDHYFGWEG